jgi:Holliday junction resolvase RusA-like endonuclease
MIEFFLPMIPPTATAQGHEVNCRGRKPVFYDPVEVKEMKAKFLAVVAPYHPDYPLEGPIRLTTKWIWPGNDVQYKITKPDTDNSLKAFKDALTKNGYWHDDAQVASEITEKFWGPQPGIYVRIEALS